MPVQCQPRPFMSNCSLGPRRFEADDWDGQPTADRSISLSAVGYRLAILWSCDPSSDRRDGLPAHSHIEGIPAPLVRLSHSCPVVYFALVQSGG
jgi:hypothetical protein